MNWETRASIAKNQIKLNDTYYIDNVYDSAERSKFYSYNYQNIKKIPRFCEELNKNIFITDRTTVDEIYHIRKTVDSEYKVAALNFASFTRPGGLFTDGSNAQEESLCHASTLYNVLTHPNVRKWYKHDEYLNAENSGLYQDTGIYIPDIIFNQSGRDQNVTSDIITVAAPFQKKAVKNGVNMNEVYKAIDKRVHCVFDIAMDNDVDILILGAFGCGVFGCNTSFMATTFKKYLCCFSNKFKKVIFAIPSGKNDNNHDIFNKVIFNN